LKAEAPNSRADYSTETLQSSACIYAPWYKCLYHCAVCTCD